MNIFKSFLKAWAIGLTKHHYHMIGTAKIYDHTTERYIDSPKWKCIHCESRYTEEPGAIESRDQHDIMMYGCPKNYPEEKE